MIDGVIESVIRPVIEGIVPWSPDVDNLLLETGIDDLLLETGGSDVLLLE